MVHKLASIAALLILVGGCRVPLARMVLEPGQPTVKMRFSGDSSGGRVSLLRVNPELCPGNVAAELVTHSGDANLPKPENDATDNLSPRVLAIGAPELLIPAEVPFVFQAEVTGSTIIDGEPVSYSCRSIGVFMPRSGEEYDLEFRTAPPRFTGYVGGSYPPFCEAKVAKFVESPRGGVLKDPEPSFRLLEKRERPCEVALRAISRP